MGAMHVLPPTGSSALIYLYVWQTPLKLNELSLAYDSVCARNNIIYCSFS